MREIGGYMEFETYHGKEYYENLIHLNTARNAILYIYKAKNYKKMYFPHYLGWSIFDLFDDLNLPYERYYLKEDWTPNFENKMKDDECLFIVNYFGQFTNEKLLDLSKKYGNIMVDNTHAFFQNPAPSIDTFYTCHKCFGVADGAYLSTNKYLEEELQTDISYIRFQYLIGRYETEASKFHGDCKKADDDLRFLELKGMSKLSQNILRSLDYNKIEQIRKDNFNFLHQNLSKYNELKDLIPETFMYPFMIKDGQNLRKKLIEKKIYIPLFWKNVLDTVDENTLEYYMINNILPIPIDHRYGLEEMNFIVEEIKNYFEFF